MSKIRNAHKRFRQGRTTYAKLKALVNEELAKHMKDMQDLEEKFKTAIEVEAAPIEEHVHDENCHHFVKHGEPRSSCS